jgi:hypothetical protein
MTARTGQLGEENRDRTCRTGQLGQDNLYRTARTGQVGQDSWDRPQDGQNMKQGQEIRNKIAGTGKLRQDE